MTQRTAVSIDALSEKVSGVEKDYQELKGVVVGLSREMREGFNLIHAKLDTQQKTPWIVIFSGFGVLLTVLGMVGYLAYAPIRDVQIDIKAQQLRDTISGYERDVRIADRLRAVEGKLNFYEGVLKPLTK